MKSGTVLGCLAVMLACWCGAARAGRLATPRIAGPIYRPAMKAAELVQAVGAERLIFLRRQTFHSSHFYTDFIDGSTRYGGNLCVLDLRTGKVTDLLPTMKDGIFDYLDLSFDAKKVVFGWKKAPREGYRIYECRLDISAGAVRASGLRQLTFPPKDEAERIAKYDNSGKGTARWYYHQTDDMHPAYLPDGGIVFTSSRCEYGTLCDAPDRLTTAVLHRMDGDGKNTQQLTRSPVSEFAPSVMDDGRILYTRWEYVDKGQLGIKCLWAMNADGTGTQEIYGNDIPFPPTMLHGRQMPGQSDQFVMLGTPHYPQSGIGTVIRVDTTRPIRTKQPMTYVTPWVDIQQEPGWNQYKDGRWTRSQNGPLYMCPFPVDEGAYLVSHNRDQHWKTPDAYGIYLLDEKGNHTPVYHAEGSSCWYARPIKPRRRPPVTGQSIDAKLAKRKLAVCAVADVYHGMAGVTRGEVKYLRVMEQIPRPWACRRRWSPAARHTRLVSNRTALAAKALHGVVPVAPDGSAHFYVPADRNIYLAALDANFLELQRERTYVNYRPGERRSCVGCHETPDSRPPATGGVPIALARPPVHPQPQPGDKTAARVIHYPADVQPVLDRHCVRCHKDLTGELTTFFCKSYEKLLTPRNVPTGREAGDFDRSEYEPAKTFGSYASPLARRLLKGCRGAKPIPLADRVKITTWIDAAGVYYGSYWGRLHIAHKNHPNFRPTPTLDQAVSPVNPWEEYKPELEAKP